MPTTIRDVLRGDDGAALERRRGRARGLERLVVDRLISQLTAIWDHRTAIVVAPPGAGKTTLLEAFAAQTEAAIAWYRVDPWDRSEGAVAERIERALAGLHARDVAAPGPGSDMPALDDRQEPWEALPGLLIIDDLHVLDGSPAERVVERLLHQLPPGLRVLAATRSQPQMNLSRLRLSGDLVEVTADDLRLRIWEVERLFRDHYREPLMPEELARLASWTEGWAAGLQLFHLATRGRPADERRRVLRALGPRSRLAREYLAQNALDRVPDELRGFLVATSVLGRLNGGLCDSFLERSGSESILAELERRCLFTSRLGHDGDYRYHEVFRSHLQGVLLAEIGEAAVQDRFRAAGLLLLSNGATSEALEAFVRAESWDLVESTLEVEGETVADASLGWLWQLEQRSLVEDPWLGLANARRLRAAGRFQAASAAYAAVAGNPRSVSAAQAAQRERIALLAWLEPGTSPQGSTRSWWSQLRRALRDDPLAVSMEMARDPDAGSALAAGLAALLGGDLQAAQLRFAEVEERDDAEGLVACVASLARGCAMLIAGDEDGVVEIIGAVGAAEGFGCEWLARLGRSMLALTGRPEHMAEAGRLEGSAALADDAWGAVLARAARAWGAAMADGTGEPDPRDGAVAAATSARDGLLVLGAPALAAWAAALAALLSARRGGEQTSSLAAAARGLSRATSVEPPGLLARLAMAVRAGDAGDREALVRQLRGWHLVVPIDTGPADAAGPAPGSNADPAAPMSPPVALPPTTAEAPASLRLLGRFELRIDARQVDTSSLRPRVRSLLHLLALDAGTPLHREVIAEALWPGADPVAAARNLHVAVASLRRVLEPNAGRGSFRLVLRDGDGYLLALPPGSVVDLVRFDAAVAEARRATQGGARDEAQRWSRVALECYGGDLLPEAGPAEWVVRRREGVRGAAVDAATTLAQGLLDQGEHGQAAQVASSGIDLDRFHDPLWRIFITAREAAGDRAAALSARAGYERVLADLGLDGSLAQAWRSSSATSPKLAT